MADPKFPFLIAWRLRQGTRLVDADLRHPLNDENGCPVGAWFNLQEASDFSDKRRSEIEAARRAGKLPKKTTVRKRATIEDLLDDWSKSAEYTALSAASQSSYRKCISAILYRPQTREAAAKMRAEIRTAKLLGVAEPAREFEAIATATPSSIGNPELRAFYNYARSLSRRLRTQPHAAHAWPPHRRGRRVAVCGSRRRLQPTSCGRGLLQAGRIVRRPRGHGPLVLSTAIGLMSQLNWIDGTALGLLGLTWDFRGPVKLGDTICAKVTPLEARPSNTPGRGVLKIGFEVLNQRDEVVQTGSMVVLMRRRPAEATRT